MIPYLSSLAQRLAFSYEAASVLAELEEVVYPLNRSMWIFGKQQTFVTAWDSNGGDKIASLRSASLEQEAQRVMVDARVGED